MDKLPKIAKILGISIAELYGEQQLKEKKSTPAIHGNLRLTKMQEMFGKLFINEQRVVLKQIQLLAGKWFTCLYCNTIKNKCIS